MKKFKKSLVILPAIATMALTTVASVTGTVAWFTANQTATVTGSIFKTGTNEGNLIVTVTNTKGVSCTNESDSSNQIITTSNTLLDASYNGTYFFTDAPNSESPYQTVQQQYATDSTYWYAFSWTLTFSVDVEGSGSTYDIFFDVKNSSATPSNEDNNATKTAFRTYMKSSSVDAVVWAPNSTTAQVNGSSNELGYVNSESATAQYTVASTTSHGLISNEVQTLNTLALDKGTGNTERGDYLGTTTTSNKKATLDVNVVVWYEGLDANMVTANLNSIAQITSTMKFYSRLHA